MAGGGGWLFAGKKRGAMKEALIVDEMYELLVAYEVSGVRPMEVSLVSTGWRLSTLNRPGRAAHSSDRLHLQS